MVLVYHLNFDHPIGQGQAAMEIFFVLSGYMIMRSLLASLEKEGSVGLWHFVVRRVRRLLPAMLAFVLGALCLHLTLPEFPLLRFLRAGLCALAGGYNFLQVYAEPGFLGFGHIWSLSVEEQFYLCAVFFVLLVQPLGLRRQGLLCLFATLLASTGLVTRLQADAGHYPAGSTAQVVLPPLRFWAFGLGVYAAALADTRWWRRVLALPPVLLATIAALAAGGIGLLVASVEAYNSHTFVRQWAVVPVLTAVLVLLAPALDALGGRLSMLTCTTGRKPLRLPDVLFPALRFVGLASYSIYLWHALVIAVFVRFELHREPYAWPAMFILCLGTGFLSWYFIERRFYSFTAGPATPVSAAR
jgi:peptidoglycan/LPS O-acetylase OafA/YrhL